MNGFSLTSGYSSEGSFRKVFRVRNYTLLPDDYSDGSFTLTQTQLDTHFLLPSSSLTTTSTARVITRLAGHDRGYPVLSLLQLQRLTVRIVSTSDSLSGVSTSSGSPLLSVSLQVPLSPPV